MSIPNFVRTACASAFTTALAVTLVAAPLWAQSAAAPPTRALRATHLSGPAPTIDGLVDDDVWTGVTPFGEFVQQDPREGEAATEKTEVRLAYDAQNLYIGVVAFDTDPGGIIYTQSKRDADLTDSDSIQFIFDTYNDHQNGFVFGTNPSGVEYDGQVAGEGSTGSSAITGVGGRGSTRGGLGAFNANWDADWTVRSQVTARGWEAELAIPLKTLRYTPGSDKTWGFNAMRNIRRRNEQSYLQPIPRGYNLTRVSLAAQLGGLDLPQRRDLKVTPFAAARYLRDNRFAVDPSDTSGDVGLDVKWGITPKLTADVTVNTDFAQVEADDEQVNLTRFELFFPEKRPFFLENASIFQFGSTQQIDLFFSRRIGFESGTEAAILGGGRVSGKVGNYNVGLLNMQTRESRNRRTDALIAPANNFFVSRVQREFGRSNVGAIFINRQGVGDSAGSDNYNRAYGVDTALQTSANGKLFAFLAGTTTGGGSSAGRKRGTDKAGRVFYTYNKPGWFNGNVGYAGVGDNFSPEVGYQPRTSGYHFASYRAFLDYQPKKYPYVRRVSPHIFENWYWGLDGQVQTMRGHYHFLEIQPRTGGRWGARVDREQDRPLVPFTIYSGTNGKRVVIPPGLYGWHYWSVEYFSNPSAPLNFSVVPTWGSFYSGDYRQVAVNVEGRIGARLTANVGLTRGDYTLPYGNFTTTLLPMKLSYSFTPLATLGALVQYNAQNSTVNSNIRLALLNRSGTGLFLVYNDQRDTSADTRSRRGLNVDDNLLGRSFIVKYTRLFDF